MVEYPGDVRLFVNGSYVEGAGEARQPVRSPVNGEGIGSVPVPVQADIDAAVAAASAAQGRWAGWSVGTGEDLPCDRRRAHGAVRGTRPPADLDALSQRHLTVRSPKSPRL